MRTLTCLASLAMLTALGMSAATAQPPDGRTRGMMRNLAMLASQEDVQKDLKVNEEQGKKLNELRDKTMEKMQGLQDLSPEEAQAKRQEIMKESEKALGEILKEDQVKRLKQIGYQVSGPGVFNNPDVASALKITDDQKTELQKINQELNQQRRELFQGGQFDDDAMKKMRALQTEATEKAVKLLTDDQKKQWKEMTGEPFKGEIRFGPRR